MAEELDLTEDQKAAIESDHNMVITACPGSGKTTVVVEKIRKNLLNLSDFQGVIGVTFTVKASKELSKRSKRDGFNIKASFFGTIDHFCLSEIIYPFISHLYPDKPESLECKTFEELDPLDKDALPKLNEPSVSFCSTDFATYDAQFQEHYKKGIVLLEAVGVIACHIIESSNACRRYIKARYKSLFIDEYQDSSEPQHQLFLSLMNIGLQSTAVGDVQQSIYAWRGSSSEYIQQLIDKDDVFEHHIVNINHRCHKSITNYANRLFDPECKLHLTDDIRVYRRVYEGTQEDVVLKLNTLIPKIAKKFSIEMYSDIAVLVRSNRSLEYVKANCSIPARVYTDDPLVSINTPVTKLYSALLLYKFDHTSLINDVLDKIGFDTDFSRQKLFGIRKLIQSVRDCSEDATQGLLESIPVQLLKNASLPRENEALKVVLGNSDYLKQYKSPNNNEIQVMTLHKAKGLEFSVVIHLDLYDWVFPFRRPDPDFSNRIYPSWDQELNLHYVGITRAKTACLLVHSSQRLNSRGETKRGTPSPFLELPSLEGLYK